MRAAAVLANDFANEIMNNDELIHFDNNNTNCLICAKLGSEHARFTFLFDFLILFSVYCQFKQAAAAAAAVVCNDFCSKLVALSQLPTRYLLCHTYSINTHTHSNHL